MCKISAPVVQSHLRRITLGAMLILTSMGLSAGLPQEALDPDFLRKLEWSDIEPVEKLASNWSHIERNPEPQTFPNHPDLSVARSGQLEIDGIAFDASIQHFQDTGLHKVVFASALSDGYKATTQNMDFCSRKVRSFNDQYGEARKIYDLSRSTSNQTKNIEIGGQWDIGETRFLFTCTAFKMYEGFIPLIFLVYGHKSTIDSIVMPINIVCSVTEKGIGAFKDKKVSESPPFQVTIRDDRETIISRDKNLGKVQHFSDQRIITSWSNEGKNIESRFTLNRVTGTYEWEILSNAISSPDQSGILMWGQCERVSADSQL